MVIFGSSINSQIKLAVSGEGTLVNKQETSEEKICFPSMFASFMAQLPTLLSKYFHTDVNVMASKRIRRKQVFAYTR